MPSVIALLERREVRARQELDACLERLREVQEQVTSCQERVDCARIGREEVLRALAEEGEAAAGVVEAEESVPLPRSAGLPVDGAGVGRGGWRAGRVGAGAGAGAAHCSSAPSRPAPLARAGTVCDCDLADTDVMRPVTPRRRAVPPRKPSQFRPSSSLSAELRTPPQR